MKGGRISPRLAAAAVFVAAAVAFPARPSDPRSQVAMRQAATPLVSDAADPVAAVEVPPAPVVAPEAAVAVEPPVAAPAEPATGPRKLMLIGDSMAFTAAEGLKDHAAAWNFVVANEGIMGCGVVRGGPFRYFGSQREFEPRCDAWPSAWQAAVDRNAPDVVAIVVGRWELMDRLHDGRWTNVFDAAFAQYLEVELEHAFSVAGAAGARVVVFTTPYYQRGLTPDGGLFPEDDPARVDAMNAVLRRVTERRAIPVIDVGGWLSPEGHYTRNVEGVKVRSDGVHLTRQTGALLAPWLFPQLQAV